MSQEKHFINLLENKILLPYYFNHVNFRRDTIQNEIAFHNFFENRLNRAIANLSNLMGTETIFVNHGDHNRPRFLKDSSAQANHNVNINKRLNEVNQFRVDFHPDSCFYHHFKTMDVYGSFFNNKNTIEGAVGLNIEYFQLDFLDAAQRIYLVDLLNYFIRKQVMPLSFDNIVEMLQKEMTSNFLNEIKKSYVDRFNQIDFNRLSFDDLQAAWAQLVEDKIDVDTVFAKEYIKNDLFKVFFSAIMIVLFLLRSVNQALNHVFRKGKTLTSTETEVALKRQDTPVNYNPAEMVKQLMDVYLQEIKADQEVVTALDKYLYAISFEKTRYVNLVEKQYLKGHIFISDLYFVLNCDYEEWDHSFFRNKVFHLKTGTENENNNRILIFSDMVIHPEKYAIDFNTKNFAYLSDFLKMLDRNLKDCVEEVHWESHVMENNVNNFILCRRNYFINNQYDHFLNDYNRDFFKGMLANYLWGIIILLARNNVKIYIEQYANFVTNMNFRYKSLEYRVILKDLQKIEFAQIGFIHGTQAMNEAIKFVDEELHYTEDLNKLIFKVRTEDEIGKLIAERNSIATGFIVAEFVSLMWFVDTIFAIYQSTGSGNSPIPYIIPEALFHGFVGFTTFVLFVITCTLLYTIIRIFQRYAKEDKRGLRNFW